MSALSFLLSAITSLAAVTSSPIWQAQSFIDAPESVYFDSESKQIFVSNISGGGTDKDGKGWIQILNLNGQILKDKWVSGLNAPKGMRSHKGVLWVTDIDEVLALDIRTGKALKKILIENAKFLNDIAIGDQGDVFVSDTIGRTIYKITGDQLEVFLQGDVTDSPNGLLINGNKLIVASWGLTEDWSTTTPGQLYSLDLNTKEKTWITKEPLGNLDGLEFTNDGSYLTSDWSAGKVYKVDAQSGKAVELPLSPIQGMADIGYIAETNTLLIPYMNNGFVEAYSLKDLYSF